MHILMTIIRRAALVLFAVDAFRAKQARDNQDAAKTAYYMGWAVLMYIAATA